MQYDVKTPEEYINALDDDWRKDTLEDLRKLIKSKGNWLQEGIAYKMLSYSDEKGTPFYLNAQKNYASLYVGDARKIDSDGSLLKGINIGKGCIRFTKSVKVEGTRIDEFIEKALNLWRKGEDISC